MILFIHSFNVSFLILGVRFIKQCFFVLHWITQYHEGVSCIIEYPNRPFTLQLPIIHIYTIHTGIHLLYSAYSWLINFILFVFLAQHYSERQSPIFKRLLEYS